MFRNHVRLLRLALLLADGLAAVGLFVLVSIVRLGAGWTASWEAAGAPWWTWAFAYAVIWVGAEWLQELDQLRSRWTLRGEVTDILRATLFASVSVFSLLFLVHAPEVSRLFLAILFSAQLVFSIAQRGLLRWGLVLARNRNIGTRNLLVLGTGAAARDVAMRLARHPALGYRITGYLGQPSAFCPTVLAPIEDVEVVMHDTVVDEVLAAFETDELDYVEPVAALCHQEGKRMRLVLLPHVAPISGGRVETLGEFQILTISNGPDRLIGLAAKRVMDVLLASLALVVLSPVLLVLAAAIWLEDRGPVLFRQTRVGLNGRPFKIVKFRTMVPDAEARLAEVAEGNEIAGPAFKIGDDPRITRIGRILRRTSMDELPQFWNALRGQMSIVGPRPPIPGEVAEYDLWHRRRLSMKPGITGLWQVSARLEAEFDRWVELDLTYIDRWSIWLDLKIMARTIPAMLSGR
jgi:exopolysaccharide biosynthesis polyprenyl glycosylphosphotransferase